MTTTAHAPGLHVLLDLYGARHLTDAAALERCLRSAADAAGATVLACRIHHFGEGSGVTGVLLLAESHISIHTWPERNFAAVDIFMCGATDVERAAAQLIDDLEPDHIERASMERGQRNQ